MSFSLKLLGGVALEGESGSLIGPAVQRHRLALLALLATASPRAVSRDKLMAWLWPERDSEPARRLLNQAVHALRQALGAEAILSAGDELQLNPGEIHCDLVAFEEALASGAPERAVALYRAPSSTASSWATRRSSSAGWTASGTVWRAATLRRWKGWPKRRNERGTRARRWSGGRPGQPTTPTTPGSRSASCRRWSGPGTARGHLQHAMLHQQLLREELEIEPGPEVQALVERLRREPAPTAVHRKEAAQRLTVPPPTAVTLEPTPHDSAPAVLKAPPQRRRTIRYGAAVILLAAAVGGAIRLAARSGETNAVPSPKVVDEIAQAVARELDRRERGDTGRKLPQHRTRSLAAYELYLRGEDPALIRSDSGAQRGLEYFRKAVALDSNYAAAWVGLARLTYRASGAGGPAARVQARVQSEAAVRKALALDDSLAEAHALLGVLRAMDGDYATAEQHLRRALALDPARTRPREWFVAFLVMTGRHAEALAEAERVVELDPLSPTAIAELARALAANRRCDEALARLETIKGLDPPPLRVAGIAAQCYGQQGRWADAIAVLRPQAERDSAGTLALLGYMTGRAGHREDALSIQARLHDRWQRGLLDAMNLAYVPAALGDRDQAFTWLDRGIEDGSLRFAPVSGSIRPTLRSTFFSRIGGWAVCASGWDFRSDSECRTGAGTPTRPGRWSSPLPTPRSGRPAPAVPTSPASVRRAPGARDSPAGGVPNRHPTD